MAVPTHITVEGFKSIRMMELQLLPAHAYVLIGANGSGKSNFLSVFKLLSQIGNSNLRVFAAQSGGADLLLHYGRKITSELLVRATFSDRYVYEARLIPDAADRFIFENERYVYIIDPINPKTDVTQFVPPEGTNARGHSETTLRTHENNSSVSMVASEAIERLKNFRVFHFQDTSEGAKVRQTAKIDDNYFLHSDGQNLAPVLYRLKQANRQHYDQIVKTIQLAAPFFDDFELRPVPENRSTIRLQWREKGSDQIFGPNDLSDGTLRFICLTTLLMQPEPPWTIVLDEPEIGLHPFAETLVASMVTSVAAKGHQVILATHSSRIINEFSPENIIVVEREDGQSVFKLKTTNELKDWLEEYSLGEIWEKNIIGGRP